VQWGGAGGAACPQNPTATSGTYLPWAEGADTKDRARGARTGRRRVPKLIAPMSHLTV